MSEVENRGVEMDLFQAIVEYAENGPVYQMLEIKPRGYGKGWARLSMLLGRRHSNAQGIPHGGLITTLIDAAMGSSVATTGRRAVTAELTTHFISSPQIGKELVAEGEVVAGGSRLIFTKAAVTCEGRLVATAQGCFMELGPLQPPIG